MAIFPKRQSTIKEVWFASLQLCRKAFSQIWYLLVMLVGALSAFGALYWKNVAGSILFKIAIYAASLALLLIIFYLISLMLCRTYNAGNEQNVSLRDSITYVNKRYIKTALSMLIAMFLVCVLIMLAAYLIFLLARFLPSFLLTEGALDIIAYMLLFGAFMYVLTIVLLIAVQPLVLFDNQGVFVSLKGSCKLVWGNWWRTFATIFPLPLMFAIPWIGIIYGQRQPMIFSNILLVFLFSPLFCACILVVFNDLKIRKR